ncbi:hypothetical protein Bca4012_057940 [Brassica carinata]
MLFLSEGSTHADLVAMAQEDYSLDMNTESVQLTYTTQQMAPDLPPIHVTSYRKVRNLLEITKTQEVRLCVSSFCKMRTVSEERDETDVGDEVELEDIIPLQRQAWIPLDMKEDIVRKLPRSPDNFQTTYRKFGRLPRRLPESPDDFQKVQTTFWKSSRRLTGKSSSAL